MDHAFNPQEVTMLAQIVDQACTAIGGCDEATRDMFAARIIALAGQGERDFKILLSAITAGPTKEITHAR